MVISEHQCRTTLERLTALLKARYPDAVKSPEWDAFAFRLEESFPTLLRHLLTLYGHHFDFYYHLERLLEIMANAWLERSPEWKSIDVMREADPSWYQSGNLIGAMAYVDLFSGDIRGMQQKIPYLKDLGVTYLHLMPLYRSPRGDDDGGYAVSSYRDVDTTIGDISDLRQLAEELRRQGISLVLDFVFNHTSDEHDWAQRAFEGQERFQGFYLMFDSHEEAQSYEKNLRSIFPDEHPGCFTYLNRLKKWVWTTFHTYQWDLNYRNPEVFNAMAGEMLFLANVGVEILRLDAVPFCWKEKGTSCENLPEAHTIIRAFNAIVRIVAPGMIFKSEAIVAPDEISKYIGTDECQISYNPLLMALLWEGLATRSANLLRHSMVKRFQIKPGCAWVNYVRSHDDIGWGFDNTDAAEIGIDAHSHRQFLTAFYTGKHESSFAEGIPFQEDPATGDARVCGTTASLCGLGKALAADDPEATELALRRILLIHGISFTIGGIPLIYLGEEIGMRNDHAFESDPEKEGDARWIHRPFFDWEKVEKRTIPGTVEQILHEGFLKLSQLRLKSDALARGDTEVVHPGNEHVFAYFRTTPDQSILCLANFSEEEQVVPASRLRQLGLKKALVDIIQGRTVIAAKELRMDPLQFMVLLRQGG
jgi:amylosucrase